MSAVIAMSANRDLPQALADCDESLRLGPGNANTLDSRGFVYLRLDRLNEAIAEYDRVKDRFADAGEAIDFFTRKEINLPEVTTVKPGVAAKVPLKYRNVIAS